MYASKHQLEIKANPAKALWQKPEGPNSGYVVVKEDDTVDEICCCGLSSFYPRVWQLPFPQNKVLSFYMSDGEPKVLFVPVINYPLSANRYYVVLAEGNRKGQVYTCSKEENMTTCCFRPFIKDVKPKPFDPRDIYQQIEIIPLQRGMFTAKSVADDGFPPFILREKGWPLFETKTKNYQLGDAFGVNYAIRLNFLQHDLTTNVVAGKWYCPFIFVKEDGELKDQMKKACYYEVTLEQHWQKVSKGIEKKRILLRGTEIMEEERESNDGFVWFTTNGKRIGLSLALWERIIWEEKGAGWDDDAMVKGMEFGTYVLVERFCFKRLDGSVALALDFIHTDKICTK